MACAYRFSHSGDQEPRKHADPATQNGRICPPAAELRPERRSDRLRGPRAEDYPGMLDVAEVNLEPLEAKMMMATVARDELNGAKSDESLETIAERLDPDAPT